MKPKLRKYKMKDIKGQSTVKKEETKAVKKEAAPQKLKVKEGMKFRGAREEWYKRLTAYDGKPVEDFIKSCTDEPPALTKAGTAENPRGWLRYFVRSGALQLQG